MSLADQTVFKMEILIYEGILKMETVGNINDREGVETVDWRICNFINLIKLNYSCEYFKTELKSS